MLEEGFILNRIIREEISKKVTFWQRCELVRACLCNIIFYHLPALHILFHNTELFAVSNLPVLPASRPLHAWLIGPRLPSLCKGGHLVVFLSLPLFSSWDSPGRLRTLPLGFDFAWKPARVTINSYHSSLSLSKYLCADTDMSIHNI